MTREKAGDLVRDGIDVALRFGPPPGLSSVSRRLLDARVLTIAAPAYLARHGRPAAPADLSGHRCIQFRDPATGQPFQWQFIRGPETVDVTARGPLTLGDVGVMLDACLAGAGIAQVLALGTAPLLADGRLVDLFPDWPGETFPLHAVYPSRHQPPARVRAVLNMCLAALRDFGS